ncbi:MAG: type I restriction enzyme HsdR N-terminal domain-containing protein [Cyclobacteriaceae bacterium]|nr:type I restriction enzyme HsdR N-terminal domain-containing protein [Cyclobacteriaceae bacterium]
MTALNLPGFEAKVKKSEGKVLIFDAVRKKYVVLTPEEWVRQHVVNYLIHHRFYPKALFRIEGSLTYNRLQKRSDILVYDRVGKPWMLIECKSSDIKLSQRAFNQVAMYNMTVGARYVAVSNGMVHFCCLAPGAGQQPEFLEEFPEFESQG